MEHEINQDIISKYVNGLYQLSVCTGKIDVLLSYCENNYSQDNFLLSSIESLLNDVLKANGNDKDYNRIKICLCPPSRGLFYLKLFYINAYVIIMQGLLKKRLKHGVKL